MKKPFIFSTICLFVLVIFTGCSGGYDVEINKEHQNFNAGVRTNLYSEADKFQVQITGSKDPLPQAVDDESSLVLTAEFDRAAFATMPRNVPLAIKGTTTFAEGVDSGTINERRDITFQGATNHTNGIRRLWFVQSCFCARQPGTQTQQFDGTVTLINAGSDTVRFRFALQIRGHVPFRTTNGLESVVDIVTDIPVRITPTR